MSAQNFYGDAYKRAKDPVKLDQAFERLEKALASEATRGGGPNKIVDGLVTLACKNETEAFA